METTNRIILGRTRRALALFWGLAAHFQNVLRRLTHHVLAFELLNRSTYLIGRLLAIGIRSDARFA